MEPPPFVFCTAVNEREAYQPPREADNGNLTFPGRKERFHCPLVLCLYRLELSEK